MINSFQTTFSVYESLSKKMRGNLAVNHRRTMSYISHLIERSVLAQPYDSVVYAGFQEMSKFLPRMKMYTDLAQKVKRIYVFGVADIDLPNIENITFVPLQPNHQLTKEWFLVAYGTLYSSALATEELTNLRDPNEIRVFQGVWTFNQYLVKGLFTELSKAVGDGSEPFETSKSSVLLNINAAVNEIQRDLNRVDATVTQELSNVIEQQLHPERVEIHQS